MIRLCQYLLLFTFSFCSFYRKILRSFGSAVVDSKFHSHGDIHICSLLVPLASASCGYHIFGKCTMICHSTTCVCCISGKFHLTATCPLHFSSCLVLLYGKHADLSNDFVFVCCIPENFLRVLRIGALLGIKFHSTRHAFAPMMPWFCLHDRPFGCFFLNLIGWAL